MLWFCIILLLVVLALIVTIAWRIDNHMAELACPATTLIDQWYKIEKWVGVRDKYWTHCLYNGKPSRFPDISSASDALDEHQFDDGGNYRIVQIKEEIVHVGRNDPPITERLRNAEGNSGSSTQQGSELPWRG